MAIPEYSSAEELFLATRDAALDLERIELQMDSLAHARFRASNPFAPKVSQTGTDVNKNAASNRFLDFTALMQKRIQDNQELIDFCAHILYGEGYTGGVAALLGRAYADTCYWRYIEGDTWETVGRRLGISSSSAKRYAAQAFDLIDAYGFDHIIHGLGIATQ